MTRTLRYLLLFAFTALSGSAFAQEIAGKVVDDKKEPMTSAAVQVYQGGILKGGTVTDYDGFYVVKPLDPGSYDVLVLYAGYDSMMVTGVVVAPGQRTTQNFSLKIKGKELTTFYKVGYRKPLVDVDKPASKILTKEEIRVIPTTQVTDLVSTSTNTYQQKRGAGVNLGGARGEGTQYIIDGVVVRGSAGIDMAQGSVEQLEVITSGLPANLGDVSGGVVNITSRGVSQKMTGDIRLQHSIDGYNNNLVSFSVAGPIYKKKVAGSEHRKPVLGFALSGDYYDDHNRYPTYYQDYVTKGNVLADLRKNPLRIVTDNTGQPVYYQASDFVTLNDLERVKIPPHNRIKEYRLNGKLDYQLTDNMHIVAGGTIDYTKQDNYGRARSLFASEATPALNTMVGRGYLRFTQKFGKNTDTSRHSIISNAYYRIQADYQKTYQEQHDPVFKENFFDYAYVGKFTETRQNVYFPLQTDSASGRKGTVLLFSSPTGINFQRDPRERNPNLANYTTQFYNSLPDGVLPFFTTQIQGANALMNGDEPKFTYQLFYSPGSTQAAFSKFNSNQYALDVMASFDLLAGKTKHNIEFGLYYQQRIERQYIGYPNPNGEGTNSVWQLMRQLVSSVSNGNLTLDKQHPIFKVNGQNYYFHPDGGHGYFTDAGGNVQNITPGPADTIFYNYKNIGSSAFDQNLRKKLFGNASDASYRDINIDALDPSTFSLSMFSADELLNQGKSYVSYYGYTYDGKQQTGNVNFNDYWTKKDANGNYTRPIGAFSPNYIAGYIMDKFTYRDVHFNIGVRVDRYSANEKVLIDPYSLYAEKTVNQVAGTNNVVNGGHHPGNIGGNFVVYVDDNSSQAPTIIGYRSGNDWYDPTGKFINDPALLKQYSNGRDPQPYLVKNLSNTVTSISDSNFNPNLSFTDYTPQVVVQPRIMFSFPISDVADFYAHYDIYSQRPNFNHADPSIYYFLQQNAQSTIANPNLKPQKTFDYEVGFQQKLSDHAALTLTAFYKERKDMITVVPYLYAWPSTYYSYGNRDFSTTKGTSLTYDMRTTNHLRMTVGYTLQFAEGTGSTPTSHNGLLNNLIEAGLPNLRYITPLDIDSRHNITANVDYRYANDEGPMIAGRHVFQNAGIDFIAKARSGEPYTRLADPISNTVIGGYAGSRLPWHYGLDMRLDKDFAIRNVFKHKDAPEGVKPKRPLYLKAILTVNNLLNTREVLAVNGFTGRPDDDGYLASPFGQQAIPQQVNPQSYVDLYTIAHSAPGNLNYARTVSIALEFNF